MSLTKDVAVRYVNATGHTNFSVVVTSKNYYAKASDAIKAAWQVLKAQSSSQFVFPASSSVSASYRARGQITTAGPFPADAGSTWEMIDELETDIPVLKQGQY